MPGFMATAETNVAATPDRVWTALTEPDQIAAYMWGTQVETTWEVGSPIRWNGQHDGKAYQDKGTVLTYEQPTVLSVPHYSPMSGQPDEPENYHPHAYPHTADGEGTQAQLAPASGWLTF